MVKIAIILYAFLWILSSFLSPKTPPTVLSHEEQIRAAADQAIMEAYSISDLTPYKFEAYVDGRGIDRVEYTLMIGNYETYESYHLQLDDEYNVTELHGDYGTFAKFLPYITEETIPNAENKLSKIALPEYTDISNYYLWIEGNELHLGFEMIVPIEDGDSNFPCSDHDHVFHSVCIAEVP